jgi:DNA helicase-2/ATP-dependent DNA helicase PcrA
MEEGLFPTSRAIAEDDLEEERRLCYVGITRAERELHLTHATLRFQFGRTSYNLISRFIDEIPEELFETPRKKREPYGSAKPAWAVPPVTASEKSVGTPVEGAENLRAGAKVRHKIFGDGVIISVKGGGAQTELTIAFTQKGIKKLMLGFAPLEIIS